MPFKYRSEPRQAWVKDAVRLRMDEGISWNELPHELAKVFPDLGYLPRERIRGAVRATKDYQDYRSKITFADKKEPTEDDVIAYFEALKSMGDAVMRLETKQTAATVTINESKPFGVVLWGDWHVGAKGVDCRRLDEDAETIADTEGLYIVGMGDYKDNASALVHPTATQESVATTDMQDLVVQHIWHKETGKVIAIVRGCHDDLDKRNANVDFVQSLCDDTGAVNLWHGGKVTIKAGDQEYVIAARHKYKNESALNTTNAQRSMMNEFGAVDVIALAHKHFPDFQQLHRMGRDVIYTRSGTYKYYDEYGQKLAGYVGEYGVPVIIFYPDQKRMLHFSDFAAGLDVLRRLRE